MIAEREIAGHVYACPKLPAEQGLNLFLAVAAALAPVPGLLDAIALGEHDEALVFDLLDAMREMDPPTAHALIMRLATIPQPKGGDVSADALAMEDLADLAVFAIRAQFGSFLARTTPAAPPSPRRDPDAIVLTTAEIRALGPNISAQSYLLRPTAFYTSEPICTLMDLRTSLTLDDLANMHEAMDLREHLAAKAAAARPKGGKHGRH